MASTQCRTRERSRVLRSFIRRRFQVSMQSRALRGEISELQLLLALQNLPYHRLRWITLSSKMAPCEDSIMSAPTEAQ